MAKPGMAYPQVEPGAAALMDRRVVECPGRRRVAPALYAAREAGAEALVLGAQSAVRRRDLERAAHWGMARLRVEEVGWRRLPVVTATAPEPSVRRLLIGGAPMILVRDGRRMVGVIDAEGVEIARPALSLTPRLDRLESRSGEDRLWLLRVAGKLGERLGMPVFAVGGFVRDLLLERDAPDVDLLAEGDGVTLARRLCEEIGGSLVIHPDFGTASIEGAAGPAGPLGRIDIASARREQYEAPGALPVVSAGTVDEDLRRRDFSVNAMALALQPSAFGRLLDPLGGQLDLKRRRLRPLHPLSFVEDPTRIFRAARYACRLGFRLDEAGMRALSLALKVGNYRALSGQRLRAEIELLTAEPRGWRGIELLLRWDVLRIWDRGYRTSSKVVERVRDAGRLCRWARAKGIELDPSEVALIALLVDQRAAVVTRCLARLGLSGEPFRRLHAAARAEPLARWLVRAARRPSDVAEALRSVPVQVLVGARLGGDPRAGRLVEWFLTRGRRVRSRLSGEEVMALGVPRGREVGQCLAALRRLRLDGVVKTRSQERALVRAWLTDRGRGSRRPKNRREYAGNGRRMSEPTRAACGGLAEKGGSK
jgi:tRNA nucleotidyltransferase (CCA-adding enzyme)